MTSTVRYITSDELLEQAWKAVTENTSDRFKGKIDHLGIFDKVLSEEEVLGLFQEGQ